MKTCRFEDDDITYYVTSDDKIFLHKNHAEKHEKCLKKEQTKKQFFASFYYNNVPYEDMKQWLKDNQLLVQDMIREP